ncbi:MULTISPECIES: carboxypeptidase-like regulatory domain-containing protein [unclassified Robiginitalea]|uniref:carboxypeptidase-like regulatory domain-containing protein n=1 Tax=Robiginitalea TaxID=252306 RepID=UPI00234B9CA8|nr:MULTISPECIES: carboxypeptidase-like regulatory domain-containing protein [unclassified Robiginitalea]MDC6355074.1 carboxypeptidase-like regulatory domain-containing protein [Robiginitalea sp. PM2]MDC6375341.1 carboxypeptidase-like regulatory domain-containing protein [Robiginitalea sp. SP8]
MKNPLLLFLLLAVTLPASAQDTSTAGVFKARVINAQTDQPLESVHVINLNQVVGTITDRQGEFAIRAAVNDTLYFSYLGFKSQKIRVTNDMFKFEDTDIALTELAYALEEVIVQPYQLTGYLEIDVKNLPINTAYQYSISGLPVSYESGSKSPSAVTKVLGAIMNPADLLRNLFGRHPRQMRKLRQIKEDDRIRDLLASKFDRETLTELLQLQKVDIEDILTNCNYSSSFIRTANDLQILDALSSCYEEYKVLNRQK